MKLNYIIFFLQILVSQALDMLSNGNVESHTSVESWYNFCRDICSRYVSKCGSKCSSKCGSKCGSIFYESYLLKLKYMIIFVLLFY